MKALIFAAVAALATTSATAAFAESPAPAATIAAAAGAVSVKTGNMLYSSSGHRIGSVYRVTSDGNPQVILDGRLVTVPGSSLSDVGGKLTTSLSKRDLVRAN